MAVPNQFLAGTRIDPTEVNDNFDYVDGRVDDVVTEVDALQAAPPGHAASHKSGGADQLYRSGTISGTTDGFGLGSGSAAHGLGSTPSFVHVTTPIQWSLTPAVSWDGTNVSVTVGQAGGAGFSWTVYWAAFG